MTLTVSTLLIVALCVATAGLAMSHLFSTRDRPYLLMFYGTRARLALVRGSIWLGAIALTLTSWILLSLIIPGTASLGIFFGFLAVLLDICGQRIRYIQLRPCPITIHPGPSQQPASGFY